MEHIITVAVVNFSAEWGNTERNLERITGYIRCAAKRGADFVVLPELALTGYDDDPEPEPEKKMHRLRAETLPGKTSAIIGELTKKLGVYAMLGMPERDAERPETVYNAAAVFGPEGFITSYRKSNLPNDERKWASAGSKTRLLDTPWGPVGLGICADVYDFPENTRYLRSQGARLLLNSTALPADVAHAYPRTAIEGLAGTCSMFVASADLYGRDRVSVMMGGSSIVGPGNRTHSVIYYAGHPFDGPDDVVQQGEMYMATLDLSLCGRSYMSRLWDGEAPEWRPEPFIELYRRAAGNR